MSESELDDVRDSIVVLTKGFLKDATIDELSALKAARNIVCVDYVDEPARADLSRVVDVYIASSIRQFLEYLKKFPERLVHLITHHADPAIEGIRGPTDYCSIGYFGEIVNARYAAELQGVIDFCLTNTKAFDRAWIQRLRHCNVHYAVRSGRPVDCFKPFLKGFTAAQCRSNIIVPLDESDARYYLGSDYPYILLDDSLKSVLQMIDYVKESFGGPEWRRGLEIMESVRQRSAPAHIAMEVKELLERCG